MSLASDPSCHKHGVQLQKTLDSRAGGNHMSTYKFWSSNFILWIALLIGGFLAAGQLLRAQDEQPSPNDTGKQALDLIRQMRKMSSSAALQGIPSSPSTAPSSSRGEITINPKDNDLRTFINEVAGALEITPIEIDEDIRGAVYFAGAIPMSKDDLFDLFIIVLKNNNSMLVRYKDTYVVIPASCMWCLKRSQPINKLPEPPTPKSEPKQSPENPSGKK
jgi:hypothetical protein